MANTMPIPLPPRTPTPPPDEPTSTTLDFSTVPFDPKSLSPMKSDFDMTSPQTSYFPLSPNANGNGRSKSLSNSDFASPFNFQPTTLTKSPVTKSSANIGQRRGHKYKHSSVSHNIFLEPPARAPLTLPQSLPIPTLRECRASMTFDQNLRFYWSICHMVAAGYIAWNSHDSAAMEALSHLVFYDSLGALLCVLVEVLGNFEVWGRSSIRHPFGLQRMEVIAGFALSILLIFFGFDLLSHNAKHFLEGLSTKGEELHGHAHSHNPPPHGSVDTTAGLALITTLISALGLQNHARIGKAMRFAAFENLPSVLNNPSHFLTISCSVTLLLLPLLSVSIYGWVDKTMSLGIALSMLVLGVHLGTVVGSMLLMSHPGKGVQKVIKDIAADPLVKSVEQAKFWQAHYGLSIASLRLRVIGSEENLVKLRERITSLIRDQLTGGYGRSFGNKLEVSLELKLDQDYGMSYTNSHHHHHHGLGLST